MSGGVDSSVSAALLKEAGHDVTGVFIKTWQPDWLPCDWRREREDAMRVAAHLGIDFKTLDLTLEYKHDVADYMIAEYAAGRTPNPDVMCNKHVKFGGFYEWALKQGVDMIVTGHYAKTERAKLFAGKDGNKDQSYFLWTLTPDILERTLFPIGEFEKSHVRELARNYALPVAEKKDSQGVCFLGKIDMREFLGHYIDTQAGDVLDVDGAVIGTHDGALFYTLGQRTGFSITVQSPDQEPMFVVGKDIHANTITVVPESSYRSNALPAEFEKQTVSLKQTNWITTPVVDKKYMARFRYRQQLRPCTVSGDTVTFDEPQKSIASGQSVVLYDEEECIGGGIVT